MPAQRLAAGRLAALVWLAGLLALAAPTLAGPSAHPLRAASAPLARAPDGRPIALTFSTDFRRFSADPRLDHVWRTAFGDTPDPGLDKRTLAGNGELEVYVDPRYGAKLGAPDLDPFSVAGGVLDITARPAPPALLPKLEGRRYLSGLISSQPSFAQTYGYFEARARLPRGKGLWPAIWLLPADMSWPPEIDIMESIGDPLTIYCSTHSKTEPSHTTKARLSGDGFHTFALSWGRRWMVWYVDGVEVARHPTPADMHEPMYLIANLAVGGKWPGPPDQSTVFPAKFSIAYIRAYRFT
ncbi:MAG TPA: glycoside hydrolase family 16 protein [Caulobacteraceae bacterium]|nr:glycoside hydrolase family 16 protein [Caulobacteraceae bacterium]